MLSTVEFIRFISLVLYCGFIVSAVTGFVASREKSADNTISIITTSLVVFIKNIACFVVELMQYYDKTPFILDNVYYVRAFLIIDSSILCIGISSVGVGFGIFGILLFFVNMLGGVFISHQPQLQQNQP